MSSTSQCLHACRACQTVLAALLDGLVRGVAPMAPHLAEDVWQNSSHAAPATVLQAVQ